MILLALQEAGLLEGRDLVIERNCYQAYAQLDGIGTALAARSLDAVVSWGPETTRAMKRSASSLRSSS